MTTLTRTLLCLLLLFVAPTAWSQSPPAKPQLAFIPNHATDADTYFSIKWVVAPATGNTYDVYLGTDPAHLQLLLDNAPGDYYNDTVMIFQAEDSLYFFYFNLLQRNTLYYWKVVVRNGGLSTESDVWSFTTGSPSWYSPEPLRNPFPADKSLNAAQLPLLKWGKSEDLDGDLVEYDLYFNAGSGLNLLASGLSDTSFQLNQLLKGNTAYSWQVVAKDNRSPQAPGPIWSFTTRNTPPPAVALSQPANQATGVEFNTAFAWPKVIDADGDSVTYELWYGTNGVTDRMLPVNGTGVTMSLAANTPYSWKVVAIDSRGDRSTSPVWTFTTRNQAGNTAPTAPALPSPANNSTGILLQQTLQWNAATDANSDPLTYTVYTGTSASQLNLAVTGLTTTSYAAFLQSNTTYYWKVEANDGKGGITASPVWSFTSTTDDIGLTNLRLYHRYYDASSLFRFELATLSPAFSVGTRNYTTQAKSILKDGIAIVLDYTDPNTTISFDLPAGLTSSTPVIYGSGIPYSTKNYLIEGTFAPHTIITVHLQKGSAKRSYIFDVSLNNPPSLPVLTLPAADQTNVSLTPTLTWTGGDDPDGNTVTYRVMTGTSPNSLQLRGAANGPKSYTFTTPLLANQRYYWQIGAIDKNTEVIPSEVRSFVTVNVQPPTLAPAPVYPREVSTYVEHNPTLVWRASSDPAATYDVYLGYNNQPVRIAQGLTDTTFALQALVPDTAYYWKVVANAQGQPVSSTVRNFFTQPVNANVTGTLTDTRDGQLYQWVSINGREWFVHNLAYLPQEKDGYYGYEPWKAINDTKNFTVLLNNNANVSKYGYLYNWAAAINYDAITDTTAPIQGVCPTGWHVATNDDWQSLYPITDNKPLLVHYDSWNLPARTNDWRNRSGLSIVPGGFYNMYGYGFEDESFQFWLAQPYKEANKQTGYFLNTDKQSFTGNSNTNYGGASVRCVRNSAGNHAPTTPVLVNPVNNSTNQSTSVSLQWTAATDADGDAITYDIYADTLATAGQTIATGLTTTSYVHSSLLAGKTYYWKVMARDAHGEAASSPVFSFSTQTNSGNHAPAAPALLQPAQQSNTVPVSGASLQWAAASDADGDAITYEVYFGKVNTPLLPIAQGVTTTSFTLGNIVNGFAYQWKVVANDGHGGLTSSAVRTFTAFNRPPTVPVLWSPVNGAIGQPTNPTVTWQFCTDPDGDRVSYRVMWGVSPASMIEMATVTDQNMYTHTTTINNTTFYWQIIATDGKGGESASEIRSYTTYRNEALTRVEQVSPVNFATNVSLNPQLNWKRVTLPYYTYSVYFGEGSYLSLEASGLTDTFYVVNQYKGASQLKPHMYYLWRIAAIDPYGNIINSENWRIYTSNNAPNKPALLSPANGAGNIPNNVTLNWTPASDPDGDMLSYTLYFGTDPAATTLQATSAQTGSYTLSNLAIGATYYWKIVVKDAYGGETASDISSFTVPNNGQNHAPSAPVQTSPAAYGHGVEAANGLHWQASQDVDGDALVYDVYLGTNAHLTAPVVSGISNLQYVPAAFTNGVTYYWKVVVKDGRGGEASSPVRSFQVKNNAPGAPVLLSPATGTVLNNTTALLSWNSVTDPDNDPVVYDVYLSTNTSANVRIASGLTTVSYTTPTVTNNTTYYWKVVARDPFGLETASTIFPFTGRNEAPSVPMLQLPANNSVRSGASVQLSWNASTDADSNPLGYEVYFGTSAGALQKVSTVYSPAFTVSSLATNTTYYWKVVAKDPQQATVSSAVWSFTNQAATPNQAPAAPALLTPANQATGISAPSVNLTWSVATDPDGDPVTYDVYLSTNATVPTKVAGSLTGTSYAASGLNTNTVYYWKVVATDDHGNATTSVINSFTTLQPAPTSYTISGVITDEAGKPLADVVVNGFPASLKTNAAGTYSTTVPVGWSGTIVPVLPGYFFTPGMRTLTNVQANSHTQHFLATVVTATNDPVLEQQVKVYPNPSTGPVVISLPGALGSWHLELFDAKGVLTYTRKLPGTTRQWTLPVPHKGVYLLQVRQGQRTLVKKVIIL